MKAKKLLALLLAMMMLLPVGCDGVGSDEEEKIPFDPEQAKAQLQVEEQVIEHAKQEYYYSTEKSVVLVLKNTYNYGMNVKCKLTTYDADGYVLNVHNETGKGIGSGAESVICFQQIEDFASYEYDLTVTEAPEEDCIADKLTYEIEKGREQSGEKTLIATVSNPSGIKAYNVVGYMLFFENGKMTGYDYRDHDDQSYFEFAPGASTTQKYGYSDTYKFIITAERATW